MKKEKQQIIDTIQKLLLLAKDQEGNPEGNVAKKKAARMMAKYRIEETEVDLETDNFILDTFEFFMDNGKIPQWPGSLVSMLCYTFDTKTVYRNYPDKREWEIIGSFSDVETVLYFLEVISTHIEKASWKTWPQKTYNGKRNQFGNVATDVIWNRLFELKNQMDTTIHEQQGCTDLVVRKGKEVAEALAELYPETIKRKSRKKDLPEDLRTLTAGIEAGKTAPLNFAIEGE